MAIYAILKETGERIKVPENHIIKWIPGEWKYRDLTKDSKKQSIPYEKRIKALEKWYNETMNGKYTRHRLELLGIDESLIINKLSKELRNDKPVRVPTSPNLRVGLEKELCPNLVKLGEKVAFAKEYTLWLTYRHRRNSIAGGFEPDDDEPNTGFLSQYRESDQRIPTPAIEIGSATFRL